MRKFCWLVILLGGFVTGTFAQIGDSQVKGMNVSISESMQLMGEKSQNALVMTIPGADAKKCEAVWKQFSKEMKTRSKKDRKTGLHQALDATVRAIGKESVDLYANFEKGGSGTVVAVWFKKDGSFIASENSGSDYDGASSMMKDFANAIGKSMAEDNVEDQEDVLKGFEKDLKKLEKDNDSYHKKIADAKALIAEMEDSIKQNLKDQEAKSKEIEAQEKVVSKAKDKVGDFDY